jgi:DNA-binding NarL/FixJ family response regulator
MTRILLIEDEPRVRANLATILRFEGYDVVVATDGEDGLRRARECAPALILCDVMIPRLDGHQMLRALRSEPAARAIPFVFLTARGAIHELREGMTLGADDNPIKPVNRQDLLAAVSTRLERHRELQAGMELCFGSAEPLLALGLTPRESEVLLWVAHGKSNAAIGVILGMTEGTVKKHLQHIFE